MELEYRSWRPGSSATPDCSPIPATLPRGVGTSSPQEVAAAVISAIERNRPEVEVAPLGLRVGASLASLAPGVAAAVGRRLGSERISEQMAATQVDKR